MISFCGIPFEGVALIYMALKFTKWSRTATPSHRGALGSSVKIWTHSGEPQLITCQLLPTCYTLHC